MTTINLMRLRCRWILCALAATLLAGPVTAGDGTKPLMVFYRPWFVAKPYSDSWGWHWTMDHFDPEIIDAGGDQQIASWYHPLIGAYDSADPAVLEYHVLLMKLAGIDGVVVNWFGKDAHLDYAINNDRMAALFQFTRKAGLKFAICYEDRTIQQEIKDGFIAASNALPHAQQAMLYAQSNYFGDPTYLCWNGQPVLLNFGPQYFKDSADWETIFSVLDSTNRPALFTEDNRLAAGSGAFNWPPMWLSLAPGARGVLSIPALEKYLGDFEQRGGTWPAYISSAFPRFHDIYQSAGARDYWGYLGDRGGDIFRKTLRRALTNDSAIVQIVTWNDYGEGTVIEPTVEYGYRDLGIIQDCRREYLEDGFSNTTNDLLLAVRLYRLRRAHSDGNWKANADSVFNDIVAGQLARAEDRLAEMEAALRSRSSKTMDAP